MTKTLYLMRHGETLFNSLGKIQGACDSPLTEKGIRQAEIAGRYFKDHGIKLDHAYCSTQERAVDTLEIVTGNALPYRRLKGIKEINLGRFEGESVQLQPTAAEYYETFYADFGGETSEQVRQRMSKTLTQVMKQEGHNHVLAVSHGGASVLFMQTFLEDRSRIALQNCSIVKCRFDGKTFRLMEVIDHDFSALETN